MTCKSLLASLAVLLLGCSSGTPPPVVCAAVTGAGTKHSSPAADETWAASANPHLIENSLTIPEGATLTLEPCVVVRLGAGADLVVNGQLLAKGLDGQLVRLERLDAALPWGMIDATGTKVKPPIDLAYTSVAGGGVSTGIDLEQSSMVRVRASSLTTGEPMVKVDHVTFADSSSVGITLLNAATFAEGSTSLTVSGSASAPVRMNGFALTNLPDGDYHGNAVDRIVLTTAERLGISDLSASLVMHKRNVPYRLGAFGDTALLTLGAPTGLAITSLHIEAGATVAFKRDFGLTIASVSGAASGELIASGTQADPVTFTSDAATPAAGDWRGIIFFAPPTAATSLDQVVFEFSGSETSETSGFSCGTEPATNKRLIRGALMFATDKNVGRSILTNSVIRDSGSNGIDRGWKGDSTDYLATNSFQRITYCTQTLPQPATGLCPSPAPCPTP